ncbi:MAG: hypothetical protein ABJA02_12380 [Acidobacteriota bacterium]
MYKHMIQLLTILVATPLLAVLAYGQKPPRAAPPNDNKPCHEYTHLCSVRIKKNYAALEVYVRHLKPGAKVGFNPQPDPPGDPSPLNRTAMDAFQRLQIDFYDLSKYPPGPCKDGACHEAIDGANRQFGMLGSASDPRSATAAIADLKPAVDKLLRSLGSMRQVK